MTDQELQDEARESIEDTAQAAVAKKLGRAPSTISQALSRPAESRYVGTLREIAAVTGQKASTVRWQIWDKSVTRCAWDGFEEDGGPAVLGAEYLARRHGSDLTNHQRRNMLRRAGELPPAGH